MQKTPLGATDLMVSRLCLGSMTWGTQNNETEAHAQIDMALAAGVNFLDTAEMYPVNPVSAETAGRTETIIGGWNAANRRRGDLIIATKIAGEGSQLRHGEAITGASIRRALEASLRRLQTDYIDLYQFHWPNRGSYHFRKCWGFDPGKQDRAAILANMADCLETLGSLQAEGKIRNWGLSNESAWGMANWLSQSEAGAFPRPASVQNEYSLLCRAYDTDLAELGHNEKVTLLAFSPQAAGLLTGKYAGDVIPDGSRRSLNETLGGRITPRVWEAVSAYLGIAARAGLDPSQMAIAWILTRPFPVVPIIGATGPDQLAKALGAAEIILPSDVLGEIAAAHKAHPMPY